VAAAVWPAVALAVWLAVAVAVWLAVALAVAVAGCACVAMSFRRSAGGSGAGRAQTGCSGSAGRWRNGGACDTATATFDTATFDTATATFIFGISCDCDYKLPVYYAISMQKRVSAVILIP
jgi:hypothetical protein